jgi:hypothetical protein
MLPNESKQVLCSTAPEGLMIFDIYEHNRRIHKNLYFVMKIED